LWFDTLLDRTDTELLEDKGRVKNKMDQFDSLLEQSPYVKKKSAEAEERGIVEGLQKAIVTIVRRRFPALTELAQQQVAQINKPDVLDYLIEQVSTAPDEAMIRQLLRSTAA
jgi:2-oxo-4-hydroxy-4-carboxy--5-ureidoimidazoline (OHCU) decarboxylase